jgi:hypothetical protein
MPKNQVTDLITDQEIAFAHLILAGTMTDRRAAEAVGLNPETAAYTKTKPRVRAYMLEHRAAMHEQIVQQEAEELRRRNQSRERVLARLWEIADLDPEMTRNSASAQMKALAMIVAIEGVIPDRRAVSAQNKFAGPQPSPVVVRDDDGPSVAADEPSDLSESIVAHPVSPAEPAPSWPQAHVPDSAAKPSTLRLRL